MIKKISLALSVLVCSIMSVNAVAANTVTVNAPQTIMLHAGEEQDVTFNVKTNAALADLKLAAHHVEIKDAHTNCALDTERAQSCQYTAAIKARQSGSVTLKVITEDNTIATQQIALMIPSQGSAVAVHATKENDTPELSVRDTASHHGFTSGSRSVGSSASNGQADAFAPTGVGDGPTDKQPAKSSNTTLQIVSPGDVNLPQSAKQTIKFQVNTEFRQTGNKFQVTSNFPASGLTNIDTATCETRTPPKKEMACPVSVTIDASKLDASNQYWIQLVGTTDPGRPQVNYSTPVRISIAPAISPLQNKAAWSDGQAVYVGSPYAVSYEIINNSDFGLSDFRVPASQQSQDYEVSYSGNPTLSGTPCSDYTATQPLTRGNHCIFTANVTFNKEGRYTVNSIQAQFTINGLNSSAVVTLPSLGDVTVNPAVPGQATISVADDSLVNPAHTPYVFTGNDYYVKYTITNDPGKPSGDTVTINDAKVTNPGPNDMKVIYADFPPGSTIGKPCGAKGVQPLKYGESCNIWVEFQPTAVNFDTLYNTGNPYKIGLQVTYAISSDLKDMRSLNADWNVRVYQQAAWNEVSDLLPGGEVNALAIYKNHLIAATAKGAYVLVNTENNKLAWQSITTKINDPDVSSLAVRLQNNESSGLYLGISKGTTESPSVYYTAADADNLQIMNNNAVGANIGDVTSLATVNNNLLVYAGSDKGLYYLSDNTWQQDQQISAGSGEKGNLEAYIAGLSDPKNTVNSLLFVGTAYPDGSINSPSSFWFKDIGVSTPAWVNNQRPAGLQTFSILNNTNFSSPIAFGGYADNINKQGALYCGYLDSIKNAGGMQTCAEGLNPNPKIYNLVAYDPASKGEENMYVGTTCGVWEWQPGLGGNKLNGIWTLFPNNNTGMDDKGECKTNQDAFEIKALAAAGNGLNILPSTDTNLLLSGDNRGNVWMYIPNLSASH